MADPFPGASDQRWAHHSPDPKVAQGGRPGRRGSDRQCHGDRPRFGDIAAPCQRLPALRCVRLSLTLPAGEIPASARGMSRPTGNRALGSWRERHELSVGTSDKRAVTQVKRLSLVMIVTRRPTASYWLEGNSRSPQEAMVTGDCGGVREHGTFGNGSIEEPERSTVVSARSGNERSMLDEWSIPEKGKRCSAKSDSLVVLRAQESC